MTPNGFRELILQKKAHFCASEHLEDCPNAVMMSGLKTFGLVPMGAFHLLLSATSQNMFFHLENTFHDSLKHSAGG
jgi:hypothetical protein